MSLEDTPGWATLTDADKAELRRFEAYLRARTAVAEGHALDTPDLLYEAVYGPAPQGDR